MKMSLNLFDAYNLRARTSVVLIYVLPFLFDGISFCGKGISAIEGAILTILFFVTVQCTLHLCRSNRQPLNKDYAAELLQPDSAIPETTRKRYYRKIASFEPEFTAFGNADMSNTQGKITTDLCKSVITWLRAKTRDNKVFSLVYEENINYGFIRNMFNLKKIGIIFNCMAMLSLAIIFFTPFFENYRPTHFILALEIAAHVIVTIYLIAAITKNKVDISAKRYAKALIETIDLIEK